MFILFFRPIIIGFVFGIIHFCILNPIQFQKEKNYYKLIFNNSVIGIFLILIGYILFSESLNSISAISSLTTNFPYAILVFSCSIFTSLILFGFIRFKDYSNCQFAQSYVVNRFCSSHLFDLNLYWFIFNAYLITLSFDSTSSTFLQVLVGFCLSLQISNLLNFIRSINSCDG